MTYKLVNQKNPLQPAISSGRNGVRRAIMPVRDKIQAVKGMLDMSENTRAPSDFRHTHTIQPIAAGQYQTASNEDGPQPPRGSENDPTDYGVGKNPKVYRPKTGFGKS